MPRTTITIASPCAERWSAMTPTATGRHCASCQETVADFTRMTDAEVVAFLQRYPSVSCGRFRANQMNRELLTAAEPINGWRRWLGATAALLGLSSIVAPKAQAQASQPAFWGGPQPKNVIQTGSATPAYSATPSSSVVADSVNRQAEVAASDSLLTIKGIVYGPHGSPISGVKVEFFSAMEKEVSVTTDANGHFQIDLNKYEQGDYAYLSVYRRIRLGLYYQGASTEVDTAHSQVYELHLKSRLKRRIRSSGKFR